MSKARLQSSWTMFLCAVMLCLFGFISSGIAEVADCAKSGKRAGVPMNTQTMIPTTY